MAEPEACSLRYDYEETLLLKFFLIYRRIDSNPVPSLMMLPRLSAR
jgi:hypothetical protein